MCMIQSWSLSFWVSNRPFPTPIKNGGFLSIAKPPSWIGVRSGHLYPLKEGPTLKPSSSKLGTCEGWNSFTMCCQSPFWNWHFRTYVASTWAGLVNMNYGVMVVIVFFEAMTKLICFQIDFFIKHNEEVATTLSMHIEQCEQLSKWT